jgi:hypothetical protein
MGVGLTLSFIGRDQGDIRFLRIEHELELRDAIPQSGTRNWQIMSKTFVVFVLSISPVFGSFPTFSFVPRKSADRVIDNAMN